MEFKNSFESLLCAYDDMLFVSFAYIELYLLVEMQKYEEFGI